MTTKRSPVISLSPDGYSRFYVIINILKELCTKSDKEITILDVGGCSPFLLEALQQTSLQFNLTILDILPKPAGINTNYIQADITSEQLAADSYDVVVTTDTLEHIEKDKKNDFVTACVRLARDVCIIAAPFDTQGVDNAEKIVNTFNKKLFGKGQSWLEEHFLYTKPNLAQTMQLLDESNYPYDHFGTNNLYSWVLTSHINLIQAKLGIGQGRLEELHATYNAQLSDSLEFSEPTYRHFFVVFKDQKNARHNLTKKFIKTAQPEIFNNYIHTAVELLAERLQLHLEENERLRFKNDSLERQLCNEKAYTSKLVTQLNIQEHELHDLRHFKILKKAKHPRQIVKSIKRRIRG